MKSRFGFTFCLAEVRLTSLAQTPTLKCWSTDHVYIYISLFSASKQIHCALATSNWMSDCRVTKFCLVWLLHGWCHVKLLLSWHTFCVHHAPILLKATHTWGACVFSCNLTPARLSESPGFLCATAKTQGWTEHRNKSRHKTLTGEKKILPLVMPGASNLRPDYKSKTTTEL